MKKLLILFVSAMTAFSVNAQLLQFGLTGDIGFDKKASTNLEDAGKSFKPDMGWSVGAKVKVSSMAGIGVDAGFNFGQEDKCYTWVIRQESALAGEDSFTVNGRLNYLSIPINLRYDLKLPAISRVAIPYAFVGPEFLWYYDGMDWSGEEVIEHARDYIIEQDAMWNLNFGFGVILFKHVELAYKHTVRLSDCLDLKDNFKDKGSTISSRFKDKTNKIALTLYF